VRPRQREAVNAKLPAVYQAKNGRVITHRGFATREEAEKAVEIRRGWRVGRNDSEFVEPAHYRKMADGSLQRCSEHGWNEWGSVYATKLQALRAALKESRASQRQHQKYTNQDARRASRLSIAIQNERRRRSRSQ
jgi:hypothetical protein